MPSTWRWPHGADAVVLDAYTDGGDTTPTTPASPSKAPLAAMIDARAPDLAHVASCTPWIRYASHRRGDSVGGNDDAAVARSLGERDDAIVLVVHVDSCVGDAESGDIVAGIARDLFATAERLASLGVARWRVFVDPGVGFGKTQREDAHIVGGIERLRKLVGGSRRHGALDRHRDDRRTTGRRGFPMP